MFKVLILTAILAVALTAPAPQDKSQGLTRPSPINPDVISDPKPVERLVVDDVDDKDHVKPVTPEENRQKRDDHEKETAQPQDKKEQKESDHLDSHNIGHDAVGCLEDKCARKISKRDTGKQSEHEHDHKPQEAIPDHSKNIKTLEHHLAPHEIDASKKTKRDHHEQSDHHEEQHSVVAHEHEHKPQEAIHDHSKDIKSLEHHLAPHEIESSKKIKRDHHEQSDHHEKPHSVVAHEGLAHNPGNKELTSPDHSKDIKTLEHHLAPHEVDSSKKHKRDIHEQLEHREKPHSVDTQEGLVHEPTSKNQETHNFSDAIKSIEERLGEHKGEESKKQKRDIPVPNVAKFDHPDESSKSEDKKESTQSKPLEDKDKPQVEDLGSLQKPHDQHEHKSTLPAHPVERHHPVPVAELFARPHNEEAGVAAAAAEKA